MTDYDFMIEFKDGKPRVWVEDAEKWRDKTCSDVSNYIKERGIASYNKYNIALTMKGSECISDYGKAKYEKRIEQLTNPLHPAYLAWGFSCMGATFICAGAVGFFTAGMTAWQAITDVARGSLACWLGPGVPFASNYITYRLFPTEQPGISRVIPVLSIATATGIDYIRYTKAASRIMELERSIGMSGEIFEGATGIFEALKNTDAKKIVVGSNGIGDKTLKNVEELKANLSKIQKILELGGQDDAAKALEMSIESISNVCYQGGNPGQCKKAVDKTLEVVRKQESAIKAAADEVQKEYDELRKKSSKLSMCGTVGQITGAIVGATTFLATYVPTDTLKVDIYDIRSACEVHTGGDYIRVCSGSTLQQTQNIPNPNINWG